MNDLVSDAAQRLRAAGIESARADARILWEHARGDFGAFAAALERRLAHEPIAYIVGHREFWSMDFAVGPGVLVPRPETEILVEQALHELPERSGRHRLLDLGTGTGCLLVALLKEYPNASGVAVDSSTAALEWTKRNVARHGMENRCTLIEGSWDAAEGMFDLVVSNPPYVSSEDWRGLQPDVRKFEPQSALEGGADGLDAYRALAPVLNRHLLPAGIALLEIGAGQAHMLGEIMRSAGLEISAVVPDLAGIPRCIAVRRG